MPLGERRRLSVVDRRRPLGIPLIERRSCRVPPRGGFRYSAQWAEGLVGSRPTASSFLACPRKEPKKGTRGCAPATHAASDWPSAKVGSALPRISGQAFSIPPAAAPRAQCLCLRVSETVPEVRPGRYGRFCVARSARGEAENCAAQQRTRAKRANASTGRCFPPAAPGSLSIQPDSQGSRHSIAPAES